MLLCALAMAAALPVAAASATAKASVGPELSYLLHFQPKPEPRLFIEARFEGGPQGFTVLGWCLSPWPDLPDCGRAVTGVTIRSELSGKILPVEHPEANIWICDHAPREPLAVRYELAPPGDSRSAPAYAPAVTAGAVMFLGDTALLVPEHLVGQSSAEIHYAWNGPLPAGWTAASSFAVADLQQTVRLPVSAFLQSFFFWGAVHPYEASRPGEPPLRVAWLNSEPPQDVREAFLASLAAIRGAVSSYLGPDVNRAATCFVLPSAPGRVSAMTLTASILFLGDAKTLAGRGEAFVTRAITAAHEFVHASRAGGLRLDDAPVPVTFLTEALAELMARRALYRAGLIGLGDWAGHVSEKLSRYASAPIPQADPYVLGDLLMILIDHEIRKASAGKADILSLVDALLRPLPGENATARLSWADFRNLLAELTSRSFADEVEDILRFRKRLRLSGDMFAGCLTLTEVGSGQEIVPAADGTACGGAL